MADLSEVLVESLEMLKERPSLFAPKIISTLIGALWFVGLFAGYGSLFFYLLTAPFVSVSGIFAAVMLAAMVKNNDSEDVLKNGFSSAVKRWKEIFVSMVILSAAGVVVFVPVALGLIFLLVYGSVLLLVLGGLISIILLMVFGFLIYFYPISLVEEGSVRDGFRDSANTSMKNSSEVILLTLFSFLVLILTSLIGESEFEAIGYSSFVVMRVLSGVVTTYIFVVSPKYYLAD